jgi:ComF family protein
MWPIVPLALEGAVAVLAPPRCAACDARVRLLTAFCPPCGATAERASGGRAGSAASALVYGGAVARAIVRMKYEGRPDLARPLADLLWRALEPFAPSLRNAVVVPVPLHPSRLAERGFNQSALIGGRIARRLGASFGPLALARTRETRRQATLDRADRAANVAGAFVVRNRRLVVERAILLVDDVETTGLTLAACARVLLEAGATSVARAVVASAEARLERVGSIARKAAERRFLDLGGIIDRDP